MNVSRDENGHIKLDSEDHSISFSWNRQVTPENQDDQHWNQMTSDVMGTPKSKAPTLNDMDWEKCVANDLKISFKAVQLDKYLNT